MQTLPRANHGALWTRSRLTWSSRVESRFRSWAWEESKHIDIMNYRKIRREAESFRNLYGKLKPSDTFVTSSGKLKASCLIHAVVPSKDVRNVYWFGQSSEEQQTVDLHRCVYNSIFKGDELGCESITLPFIRGTLGCNKAAKIMLEAIASTYEALTHSSSRLDSVRVDILDQSDF